MPGDFARCHAQFARVVPVLVPLFPSEIVETVATLAALHALSETLDTAMATHLDGDIVMGIDYIRAWQRTGRPAERQRQIALMLDVAGRLDRFTRRMLMRNSLRLMREPARAAGLTETAALSGSGFRYIPTNERRRRVHKHCGCA